MAYLTSLKLVLSIRFFSFWFVQMCYMWKSRWIHMENRFKLFHTLSNAMKRICLTCKLAAAQFRLNTRKNVTIVRKKLPKLHQLPFFQKIQFQTTFPAFHDLCITNQLVLTKIRRPFKHTSKPKKLEFCSKQELNLQLLYF